MLNEPDFSPKFEERPQLVKVLDALFAWQSIFIIGIGALVLAFPIILINNSNSDYYIPNWFLFALGIYVFICGVYQIAYRTRDSIIAKYGTNRKK